MQLVKINYLQTNKDTKRGPNNKIVAPLPRSQTRTITDT